MHQHHKRPSDGMLIMIVTLSLLLHVIECVAAAAAFCVAYNEN